MFAMEMSAHSNSGYTLHTYFNVYCTVYIFWCVLYTLYKCFDMYCTQCMHILMCIVHIVYVF